MFRRGGVLPTRLLLILPVLVLLALGPSREAYPPVELALAQALEPDQCAGDEAISVAPAAPLADEDLLVAVTSSHQHRGVWLAGSERAVFIREYEGQLGWVWNWLVVPKNAGPLRLQFFIDSTVFCTEVSILVGPSAQRLPAALTPPTPTPTIMAGHYDNDDNGDNSGDNEADNDKNSDSIGTPKISSIDPNATCAGGVLTLRGRSFGSSRTDVDGKIIISGSDVRDYLSWGGGEVVVLVPNGAAIGLSREVYLITAGGYARTTVDVNAAPC